LFGPCSGITEAVPPIVQSPNIHAGAALADLL
jgi:hypothetical protein